MAETVTARVNMSILADVKLALNGVASSAIQQNIDVGYSGTMASGTTANKADLAWVETDRVLASAATENLDLFDLAGYDIGAGDGKTAFGQAWAALEVVAFVIHNTSASAGTLIVGGEGTGATWNSLFNASDTAKLSLVPEARIMFFCPAATALAVADTTNHLLKFEASGGASTYSVHLLARTA